MNTHVPSEEHVIVCNPLHHDSSGSMKNVDLKKILKTLGDLSIIPPFKLYDFGPRGNYARVILIDEPD